MNIHINLAFTFYRLSILSQNIKNMMYSSYLYNKLHLLQLIYLLNNAFNADLPTMLDNLWMSVKIIFIFSIKKLKSIRKNYYPVI